MARLVETRTEELILSEKLSFSREHLDISVIIPVKPGDSAEKALGALRSMEYPQERLEIIVVEGRQPSRQRNAAATAAHGEIIYFLDNDSEADIDLFRFVARSFADPDVAVVGGPSEILPGDSLLQKCFGYALGSFFAVANVRCRYKAIGRGPKKASEQKLILCNLGIRTEVFGKEGGLDERLYPNEENELLNRLHAKGYVMIYNPRAMVRRPHRTSLAGFIRQMFTYGRGRMHHFRLHPQFISPAYLMPLGLLAYLLSLPVALLLGLLPEISNWYLLPAGVYAFASALSTGRIIVDEEDWRPIIFVPLLFLVVHISYALGMIVGLLQNRRDAGEQGSDEIDSAKIRVRLEKPFGVIDNRRGEAC